jgi:hypothetical protein
MRPNTTIELKEFWFSLIRGPTSFLGRTDPGWLALQPMAELKMARFERESWFLLSAISQKSPW